MSTTVPSLVQTSHRLHRRHRRVRLTRLKLSMNQTVRPSSSNGCLSMTRRWHRILQVELEIRSRTTFRSDEISRTRTQASTSTRRRILMMDGSPRLTTGHLCPKATRNACSEWSRRKRSERAKGSRATVADSDSRHEDQVSECEAKDSRREGRRALSQLTRATRSFSLAVDEGLKLCRHWVLHERRTVVAAVSPKPRPNPAFQRTTTTTPPRTGTSTKRR